MISEPVILTEGDANLLWTFTIMKNGAPVNLTGATVLLSAKDDDAPEGTNIISAVPCTVTDGPNGVCTFLFTTAHMTISGTGRVVKGRYKLKVNGVSFDEGEFRIKKDAFTA